MENIVTYIEQNGHLDFEQLPFNEVDSLVLSQLSYLNFEYAWNFNDAKEAPYLFQLIPYISNLEKFFEVFNVTNSKLLFLAAASSKRFAYTKILKYKNIINLESEMQFSASLFLLIDETNYLAFRGTDANLVGWKEDFNMSFMDFVPSQLEGINFLKESLAEFDGAFKVGGHSKGGNLAVYSCASISDKEYLRISNIYNHEGPGFTREFMESDGYNRVLHNIYTTMPKSAIIGMYLQRHENYRVVNSSTFFLFQHDPFAWTIKGTDFDTVSAVDSHAVAFHEITNNWLSALNPEKRQKFVDTVYSIVKSTSSENISELKVNWKSNTKKMITEVKDMDSETSNFLFKTLSTIFTNSRETKKALPKLRPKCFYCGEKMYYDRNQKNNTAFYYCKKCNRSYQEIENTN